jgi:hypothetical protein
MRLLLAVIVIVPLLRMRVRTGGISGGERGKRDSGHLAAIDSWAAGAA